MFIFVCHFYYFKTSVPWGLELCCNRLSPVYSIYPPTLSAKRPWEAVGDEPSACAPDSRGFDLPPAWFWPGSTTAFVAFCWVNHPEGKLTSFSLCYSTIQINKQKIFFKKKESYMVKRNTVVNNTRSGTESATLPTRFLFLAAKAAETAAGKRNHLSTCSGSPLRRCEEKYLDVGR